MKRPERRFANCGGGGKIGVVSKTSSINPYSYFDIKIYNFYFRHEKERMLDFCCSGGQAFVFLVLPISKSVVGCEYLYPASRCLARR
jgi:hypothetical protein